MSGAWGEDGRGRSPTLLVMHKDFWDERYGSEDFVYGASPNAFLVSVADRFPATGRALDIGAGEGRNALFLASRGLDVIAVDQSVIGMRKAEERARERGVRLRAIAADLRDWDGEAGSFDVISSIFVHLPREVREAVHRRVKGWLRVGGMYVVEAYAPDQIARATGGPKDSALLASLETIVKELEGLEIEHARALVRDVREGAGHTGEASVVQVVARKA